MYSPYGPLASEYAFGARAVLQELQCTAAVLTGTVICSCRRMQQIDELMRQFPGCRAINPDR